ncbi:MAG TPA: GTPase domain-containing protein [Thermoanaerobaculia bacterium]|nr:GTPase domain-containing protein [Thermoanaerobaculia bacterium]
MTAKIVYYGPGLCGKTTNLMVIFDKLDPKSKGKMLSLATKTDRTLFFDLLPVDIGKVGPFNLKIQLYTVPGQVFYNETRKLVLKGADAVVFVADSQPAMVDATRESFANLLENLEENQIDPNDTPIVIQYNKRDIPGVLPVDQLAEALGFEGYPYTEAAAIRGDGVMETFKLVSKITAKHLFARLKGKSESVPRKGVVEKAEKPKVTAKEPPAPIAAAPVEAAPEPQYNPFADSVPFPESEPDSSYEKAEEVSLEQLLAEGRERPATFAGNIAVPHVDEVEELGADALVEETPVAVAVLDEPAPSPVVYADNNRVTDLEARISTLQQKLETRTRALQTILQELDELRERVSAQLGD